MGSSQNRYRTHISGRRILYHWATREEALSLPLFADEWRNRRGVDGANHPEQSRRQGTFISFPLAGKGRRWKGRAGPYWFNVILPSLLFYLEISTVQPLSRVWLFVTPWTAARQASLSTNSHSLLKLMSVESVMPSNHLILCCLLLLLPSIFPSIKVLFNESDLHIRWPKYWSFNVSISPSNAYSGLISFSTDWFDLLAVQGTLKSLLQHHSSEASILWCSAFFTIQPSNPYMTAVKTIALTRQTFVGKVMSCFLICYLDWS